MSRQSAVTDWATWAVRAVLAMLGSGLVWASTNIVLGRERIEQHDRRIVALELRQDRQEEHGRQAVSKVASVVEDHGLILERTEVTLANLREKLDALLARPRR